MSNWDFRPGAEAEIIRIVAEAIAKRHADNYINRIVAYADEKKEIISCSTES